MTQPCSVHAQVKQNQDGHFVVLSLNHKNTTLKEIPRFSVSCSRLEVFMKEIADHQSIDELVVLSTCNRSEYFISSPSVQQTVEHLTQKIANHTGVPVEAVLEQFEVLIDTDAVQHLMRLVSGLDSMVVGDAQILGQVKSAFHHSNQQGHVGKVFHAIFQRAFSVAKRVRKETGLGKGRLSISALAVEFAARHYGSLNDKVATVIGAGKMGTLAAKYFVDAGVKELRIVNRSLERSLELAQQVEAKVYGMDEIERVLAESDIVISTTAATEHIITRDAVEAAQNKRGQAQLLIDISLPLDIDPTVAEIPGVSFVDLDVLGKQADDNLAQRNEAYEKACGILTEELNKLGEWPLPFRIDSLARQLGHYADSICQDELQTLFSALPDLTPEQKVMIEAQMVKMAERIVLTPRRNLRRRDNAHTCENTVKCLAELFDENCGARQQINIRKTNSNGNQNRG